MADEKNWQTVEEFIKQYKPVDEALKELEELRTSAALTTGTPANKLPTIFEEDPVYGSLVKQNKENALPPVILLSTVGFLIGTFSGGIFAGMLFAAFYPFMSLLQNIQNSPDMRTIITRENQHLIDTITLEKILKERMANPETTAQLTDLQIAKELAEKQGGVKTLWQQEFEKKHPNAFFYELYNNPEFALLYLQQFELYKSYFNKVVTAGLAELEYETSIKKWKNYNPIYSEENRPALSPFQLDTLVKDLSDFLRNLKTILCKEFENSEKELFFDVTLIGYICFMADLFTPANYLGFPFLNNYVSHVYKLSPLITGNNIFNTTTQEHPLATNKKFADMFNAAYIAFISSLPSFYTTFKEPTDFINAYAQLLLRFLAENSLLNTHNAEDLALLNETTRLTASILPLCEKALDTHYLPALYASLPEGQ